MAENKLYNSFEQDTKKFIKEINDSLIKLERDGYSVELINHIFRCIHSIKSEAAYLNLEAITSAAHDMESVIEPLRNVGQEVEVDPALIEFCFASIDKIGALAFENLNSDEDIETELEEICDDELDEVSDSKPGRFYTEFELMLIREAVIRGEQIYKLMFGIAEDEVMKYPRAYLAVSNLEQKVNVIKTEPSPEDFDQSGKERITVILSTDKTIEQLKDEINIDQIVRIEIQELQIEEELKNKDAEVESDILEQEDDIVPAEHDRIINEYVSEIKKRLSDLSKAVSASTTESNFEHDLAGLEIISNSIEDMMSNLQTVDFNNHFSGFKQTVDEVAAKLSKKAELKIDSDNLRVERNFAEFVAEPLLQILRNAVVHGIEAPEQRIRSGKKEIGLLQARIIKESGSLIISIADDGRGIDKAALNEEYNVEFTDEQLLELLIQPGYTTMSESEHFGGRGVGLDLVVNSIKKRNGRLELVNNEGRGCEFRMIFPNFS